MLIEDGTQPASGAAPSAPTVSDDPDQRQLDEALAEVAKEEAAEAGGTEEAQGDGHQPKAETKSDPAPKPEGEAQAQTEQAAQTEPQVPVGRLTRETSAKRQAEQRANEAIAENHRLRAQNEALTKIAQGKTTTAEPQSGTLQAVEAELDRLAEAYESGKVSERDYQKQHRALTRKLNGIEQDQLLARIDERIKATAPTPQSSATETRRLAQESNQIVTKHPYLEHLADEDMKFLTKRAVQELKEEGIEFPANGVLSADDRLMVRARLGQLSDRFGPAMTGIDLKPAGQISTPSKGQQQTQTPAMPSMANARAKALAEARSAPPDISTVGQAKTEEGMSREQFLAMSEIEIEALPEATRQRLYARYG